MPEQFDLVQVQKRPAPQRHFFLSCGCGKHIDIALVCYGDSIVYSDSVYNTKHTDRIIFLYTLKYIYIHNIQTTNEIVMIYACITSLHIVT